jgi:hypothetical protein
LTLIVALLTVIVGSFAIFGEQDSPQIANSQIDPVPTGQIAGNPSVLNPGTGGADPIPTAATAAEPDRPAVNVDKPEYANFTENITRVREHYSETYTYGTVTVGWRPGAFPVERAPVVADMTARLLGEANARLQTDFYPELEIFLADQLYTPECHGCQGFAAADLFQIFLLQDGSLAEDELEALLIHEIVHVIAAHEISLPHSLFFAEGLATWVMTDKLTQSGYLSPLQTAAWAYQVGAMPSLQGLREDGYDGRVRKRAEYDGAAAFAFFVIETYGWESYRQLYTLDPPELVLDKTWEELETEWHAYLGNWAGNTIDGVDAAQWWAAASRVSDGFGTLYTDPAPVTEEQYTALVQARLAVNRGDVDRAIEAINASGLAARTAQ